MKHFFTSLYEAIVKSWNEFWEENAVEDIENIKQEVTPCM